MSLPDTRRFIHHCSRDVLLRDRTIVPRIQLDCRIVYGLTWYFDLAFAPHAIYLFSFVPNPIVYAGWADGALTRHPVAAFK